MDGNIFLQLSVLLGVTVSIAFLVRFLRQPLLVAYIIAGIVCGPIFLNFLHGDVTMYDAFAKFGVVLLLFVVGLSLDFNYLRKIGRLAILGGVGQVIFTVFFGFIILSLLGFSLVPAAYLSVAITFSSTIIILKLLGDKKDTESTYGRYTIGLMLVQDIIAMLIILCLGVFTNGGDLFSSLTGLALNGLVICLAVFLSAKYLLPRILDRVAESSEFLFIFTVAWCFGVASLVFAAGFSLEVGALIAGLSLGSTSYQAEISSRVRPLRDFFIVLFFIILGSELTFADLGAIWLPALIIALFILIGNPLILYTLFRFGRFTRRNSFLIGVTAAQVSEFGFVLIFLGQRLGHLTGPELSFFTLVALVTIAVSSYVITYNEQIYRFFLPVFNFWGKDRYHQLDQKPKNYDVWVFGYHRIGWKVCETLKKQKIKFALVDFNPEMVARARQVGYTSFFGDAADVEFLENLPLEKAKMIISTIPAVDDQEMLVRHVRRLSAKPVIITNLAHYSQAANLYAAGADYIMLPHLLGGQWIADILQSKKNWQRSAFSRLHQEQAKEMNRRKATGHH